MIFKKISLFRIPVKPPISLNLNCLVLFLFARSRKTHSKKKFYKKGILGNFGVKVMILDFQPQNVTQSNFSDETLLLRSLLKDKATNIESF